MKLCKVDMRMCDSQPQFPKAFGGWQQGQTLLLLLHVYRLHDLGAPHLHLRQGMSFDLATGLATETQYRSSTYPGTEAPMLNQWLGRLPTPHHCLFAVCSCVALNVGMLGLPYPAIA